MASYRPTDWKNPDYKPALDERLARVRRIRADQHEWEQLEPEGRGPSPWDLAMAYYSTRPQEWIEDWVVTLDPRNLNKKRPAFVPFLLFDRQRELLSWLVAHRAGNEGGLVEKARELGVSWVVLAYETHIWLFESGAKISNGSRKEDLVDEIGNPDSLLEKIRVIVRHLPPEMKPLGYAEGEHARYMKIMNPETGSLITGEAGDNIGRGGRSTLYFVDESAFLEHPESIEASLSHNTDVRFDVSTPNPEKPTCPFHRKRHSNIHDVFTFEWHQDPRKDQEWYDLKQATLDPAVFASEVLIDYEARVEDTTVPSAWIRSSVELRKYLEREGLLPDFSKRDAVAGLDVGGGTSKSVLIDRRGPLVGFPAAWTDGDSMNIAGTAANLCSERRCRALKYDSIGVGKGVTSGLRLIRTGLDVQAINVGSAPTNTVWDDDLPASKKFANLKAELWWTVRDRLYKTHQHWLYIQGSALGIKHEVEDLLLLPDSPELKSQLSQPKYQTTESGKIQIERKIQMRTRGLASPDFAEALTLSFAPRPARAVFTRTRGIY